MGADWSRAGVVVSAVLLSGCLTPVPDGDGGISSDGSTRCVTNYLGLAGAVCAPITPVVCAGVVCSANQFCCHTTGTCVTGSGACPAPATTSWPGGGTPCASSADCAADEFCMADDLKRCLGGGHCQPITNCGSCSAPGSDRCQVCGCDGVTYESSQVACVAGVRTGRLAPCGTAPGRDAGPAASVACGTNQQCPAGAQCCFLTGKCFDSAEPWRCQPQPDGAVLDCTTHDECSNAGAGGGNGASTALCAGDGCSGPGLCSYRGSTSDCGGAVRTVCGCDGTNYVNACWAKAAGVRVASEGACP